MFSLRTNKGTSMFLNSSKKELLEIAAEIAAEMPHETTVLSSRVLRVHNYKCRVWCLLVKPKEVD